MAREAMDECDGALPSFLIVFLRLVHKLAKCYSSSDAISALVLFHLLFLPSRFVGSHLILFHLASYRPMPFCVWVVPGLTWQLLFPAVKVSPS